MCKTIFETQYRKCEHSCCWSLPSPDPNCNGIIHNLCIDYAMKCKQCWLQQGNRKKEWNNAVKVDINARYKTVLQTVYPVQELGLERTTACPTWKQRLPWHSRLWAMRQITLMQQSWAMDAKCLNHPRTLEKSYKHNTMDLETMETRWLEVVPMAEIMEMERLRMDINFRRTCDPTPEQLKKERLRNFCELCHCQFTGEENPDDNCSGGGEVARRLSCPSGHLVGIDCIKEQWIGVLKKSDLSPEKRRAQCPLCAHDFLLTILPTRNILNRLIGDIQRSTNLPVKEQTSCYVWQPQPLHCSAQSLVGAGALAIMALPMAHAVSHSMNIHGAKHGGKIPFDQMAMVFLTGLVLQVLWMIGLASIPIIVPAYAIYRFI